MGLFDRKKEKSKRPRTMMICPHCGGTDLYIESGQITGYKYHCKHCQYVGAFVIEKDVDEFIEEAEESGGTGESGGAVESDGKGKSGGT